MKHKPLNRRQKGVGLIEVLVAMVLLSLCLLGMAGLQVVALRNDQSAQSRSMATIMSYSITDSMRANIAAAKNGDYNLTACSAVSGTSLANTDVISWISAIKAAIGQTACGGINCVNGLCEITIQWDDSRATGGDQAYTLTTRIQL